METEKKQEFSSQDTSNLSGKKLSLPMAIIVAGVLIAGAVYFSSSAPKNIEKNNGTQAISISSIDKNDYALGNPDAKVTVIVYADFQCPFCGAVSGLLPSNSSLIQSLKQRDPNWSPFMPEAMNHVRNGDVLFVYRDWAFLGPESIRASEAARCAGDQNKFWEYHDYLYSHQNGENEGGFSDANLKSFAKNIDLNTTLFNQCFDENKYAQAVADSREEGTKAGVNGTPKGFILKDGKIVNTIDGAESLSMVKQKIESALK